MPDEFKATDQLKDYYRNWIAVYKEGAIRDVTLSKYKMSLTWIEKLAPDLKLCDVTRTVYQQITKTSHSKNGLRTLKTQ